MLVGDLESAILIGGVGPALADKVEVCPNLNEGALVEVADVPAAAVAGNEEAKLDGWGAGPYPPTVVVGNKSKKPYRFGSLKSIALRKSLSPRNLTGPGLVVVV